MSVQLSFDKAKDHPHHLALANNLKLCLAIEFAPKDFKFKVDEDLKEPQLVVNDNFRLFDANAILRYILNYFASCEDYEYVLSNLEPLLYTKNGADATTHDTILSGAYQAFESMPTSASKLLVYADLLALDPKGAQTLSLNDERATKAIAEARKLTPRSSSQFVNSGTSHIKPGYTVRPNPAEILPMPNERNILITSALPYVNNVPHLGNIVGSVLSADIFARYCKSRNYNALYICGTDEYGTATETKAIEEGVTPKELCDKYHKIHKDVYDWFQIGFDYFGRTTTPQQTEISQGIFMKLNENGYLEEQVTKQLYCSVHNSYLADRYVEGECPKCHYEDARGDQCDKCGSLLDPFELINPRCKLDGSTPQPKMSNHIFLSLDKLEPQLREWFTRASEEGHWSKNSKTITNSWLKDGLKPRCITRDLVWGTPVPLEKFKDKVLYVWFDATIGYSSITANYTKEWAKWWKNPEQVKLYQFMGKDNVPFHTVVYPSTQLGTKDKWTMLNHLNTTEYLQYENGKFSKSRNVGVFGDNARDSGIPPSVWRYYLASIRPETGDSHFSWDEFITKNNAELLANLGNFVNRLIKFVNAKYNGVVPEYVPTVIPKYDLLIDDINTILTNYISSMELGHERRGLELAMSLSARGNQFLQENKLDNTLFSQQPERADAVVGVGLNVIYTVASLVYPFMPEIAEKIYKMLNAPQLRIDDRFHLLILGGHNINRAEYLFSRIDEKRAAELRAKYGGEQ